MDTNSQLPCISVPRDFLKQNFARADTAKARIRVYFSVPAFMAVVAMMSDPAMGQIAPVRRCDSAGIGSVRLSADSPVTITSVTAGLAGGASDEEIVPYCLVQVRVPSAIHIWVALPTQDKWNGRLVSEGGGAYSGYLGVPVHAVLGGYVGIQTDTGHVMSDEISDFAMSSPGIANTTLQKDFAYRSQHLMAVIGKQLVQAFYGRQPAYSYWNGCSQGGREGLRMAQDFPDDYDGILAGAPAVYKDRFSASAMWPQLVMKELIGHPILPGKLKLATAAAIKQCDKADGIADGIITDPRQCRYSAVSDKHITRASCSSMSAECLTPREAEAVDRIWSGPTNSRGEVLWPGPERGTPLDYLAAPKPSPDAILQPRYWVYLDRDWDWHTLTFANYEDYFKRSVAVVGPLLASDNPNLNEFRRHGGKIVMWHGFNDEVIMPRGSIMYYDSVVRFSHSNYQSVQQFFRLFMAPGVGHCGGGHAPQPGSAPAHQAAITPLPAQENFFKALVAWVEHGRAPNRVLAAQPLTGTAIRTRPLCPYPALAKYKGIGSIDDAANFACAVQ